MSDVVLYRKYRPTNYESIVGQESIVKASRNETIKGKFSHAYIASGTRGTGKTSWAKVHAKAINCLSPLENGDPCDECESCKSFLGSLDFTEMDAASNRGVLDIRNLIDTCKFQPSNSKYKVYVIDEVHMLTNEAFNALLKTLEEPPAHCIFILATTEFQKIPATVRSRCTKHFFKRIYTEVIIERMRLICAAENIHAEEGALKLIAVNSDGSLRDALSMLDQASKLSSDGIITEELVAYMLGCTNQEQLLDFVESILRMSLPEVLSYFSLFHQDGADMLVLLQDVTRVLNDCLMLNISGGTYVSDGASWYSDRLSSLSATPATILYCLESVIDLYNKAKGLSNPVLTVRTGLALLCSNTSSNLENMAARLIKVEDTIRTLLSEGKVYEKVITVVNTHASREFELESIIPAQATTFNHVDSIPEVSAEVETLELTPEQNNPFYAGESINIDAANIEGFHTTSGEEVPWETEQHHTGFESVIAELKQNPVFRVFLSHSNVTNAQIQLPKSLFHSFNLLYGVWFKDFEANVIAIME